MILIRTLPPVYQHNDTMRDHAGRGAYDLGALEALLKDCDGQPDWRSRADKAHAYYDMGKQQTPEEKARIHRVMGINPRETNLVHGVINAVLGTEARQRTDVNVEADDEDFADVSDVLSMRMEEATRETNCDMAIADGYSGQVKGGLGWVEVSRASDPLDYPYRVRNIHRREIWYDWRAQQIDLSDARWLVRKNWQDLDEAVALYPKFADLLKHAVNDDWSQLHLPDDDRGPYQMARTWWSDERRTSIRRDDWCDYGRERIKFYEVWYRVPAVVAVITMTPTRKVAYNPKNPVHVQAVSRGLVKVEKQVTRQIRKAVFAGPHRLTDEATQRRRFPYIPFFAFRDDEDRSPYGLIEGMISPQDSYNERRQMVDWMLKARQIYIDNDALDEDYNSIEDIEQTAARPDMVAVLNANRKNVNGLRVENSLSFQKEQLEVMMNDKQAIQDVPRVYSTQMGNAPAGVTSGIAINSLTEAGVVAMGELNDNYRYARRIVHEEVMQLIVEDHMEENMQVRMGSGESRRTVVLNTWTQQGEPLNRVEDAPVKVGLGDVPNSPAFRMEEQRQMTEIVQALAGNPEALKILTPAYIEGSSLTNRQAIANDLRRATGVPVASDRAAQQAAQQQQQEEMAKQQAMVEANAKLSLEKLAAETEETKSKTELNNAKTVEIGHTMGMGEALGMQDMQRMAVEERAREQDRSDRMTMQRESMVAQAAGGAATAGQGGGAQQQEQPEPSDEERMIQEALQEAMAA